MASFLYQTSLKEMRWPTAILIARIFNASVKLQTEHLFQEKGKIMIRTAFFHLLIKHQHLKQILKEIIMIQDMEQIGR